jgi:C1A family cysteine protease
MTLPVSQAGRRYGVFRDNPFHPARKLRLLQADPAVVLPPTALELVPFKGPTRDQGNEGSCTGQSGAEKADLDYRQFAGGWKDRSIAPQDFLASAAFVYKCNLIADGDLGNDAGSSMHQTAITLNQKGAALNTIEPYSDSDYSVPPTAAQYANGLLYEMGGYHYLPDLQSMKACLAPSAAGPGHSFIFGITVYESFESAWAQAGMMPMPNTATEQVLGGHAQHVIGYDDTIAFPDGSTGGLLVQNSWGEGWGISAPGHTDGGCYWMPYAFVNAGLANDAWVIHPGPAWK